MAKPSDTDTGNELSVGGLGFLTVSAIVNSCHDDGKLPLSNLKISVKSFNQKIVNALIFILFKNVHGISGIITLCLQTV